jgi:hypothetical protein
MNLTYTIENNNTVKIYSDTQQDPVIVQPDWPNGTPWASYSEAETWAQLCIAAMSDPLAPYAPAGPGLAGEPKPIAP